MRAAWSSDGGMVMKNCRNMKIPNPFVARGMISPW
jgi:hypothetical protein